MYILKRKDEVLEIFKQYHVWIERQSNKKIQQLRTDNGGEFCSHDFEEYCLEHGIGRQLTAPYSSAHNGVAERRNRTLQDITRALIKQAELPMSYWAEAVVMSAYLLNRLPSKSVQGKTPYEAWHKCKPSVQHIRIFGSPAYAHLNKQQTQHSKLSDRARKLVFVGFTEGIKAYKLLDPQTKRVIYSRSVVFDENFSGTSFERRQVQDTFDDQLNHIPEQEVWDDDTTDDEVAPVIPILDEQNGRTSIDHSDRNVTEIDAAPGIPVGDTDPIDMSSSIQPQPLAQDSPSPHETQHISTNASTRVLRSRSSIKPPDMYSPSKWIKPTSHTDWSSRGVSEGVTTNVGETGEQHAQDSTGTETEQDGSAN